VGGKLLPIRSGSLPNPMHVVQNRAPIASAVSRAFEHLGLALQLNEASRREHVINKATALDVQPREAIKSGAGNAAKLVGKAIAHARGSSPIWLPNICDRRVAKEARSCAIRMGT